MQKWLRLLTVTATLLLLLILIASIVRLAGYITHTLLIFALGALLAYTLDPPVEWLRNTRIGRSNGRQPSREFSVATVVICILILFGFAMWSLEGRFVKEVSILQTGFPHYKIQALALAKAGDIRLAHLGVHFSIADTITNPPPDIKNVGAHLGTQVLSFLGHLVRFVGESVIVLLIAIYFLIYSREMKEKLNGMLPEDIRPRAEIWEDDVNRILGGFVRGQIIIALLVGALAAIGCLLIGIHLWLVIGLIVVGAALIPVFGPYLGVIPALLAAAIGPTHIHNPVVAGVVVLIYFVIINEIGSKILYPKLVGEALGLHTVLVLFVLFAGLEIAGVVGVLFAAPLTALVIVSVVHLFRYWQELPDHSIAANANETPP